jgi:hypothetical protein
MLEAWTLNISLSLLTHSLQGGGSDNAAAAMHSLARTLSRPALNRTAHKQQHNWGALPECGADTALLATGGGTAARNTSQANGAVKLTLSWQNVLIISNMRLFIFVSELSLDEMDGEHYKQGRHDKFIQNFSENPWKKEIL